MAVKPIKQKTKKGKAVLPKKAVVSAKPNKTKVSAKVAKAKPKPRPKPVAKAKPAAKAVVSMKNAKAAAQAAQKLKASSGRVATRPTPPKSVKSAPVVKPISKQFAGAVHAYEAAIKLMYAEDYDKAIKSFKGVIASFPDEPEVQASAKARIQACEKKLHERSRIVFRSADDHYNIAVALLNRGEFESALNHLQSALKLSPKADHILYALAAASALLGNKDQAISYLKQSIVHRPANRFQAVQDSDFAGIIDEPAFKELIAAEK